MLLILYLNTQEGSTPGFHPPNIAAHIIPQHSRTVYHRVPSSYHCCSHYTLTLKKGLPQDSILQPLLLTLYLDTQGGSTPGFHPLIIAAHIIPQHSRRVYPRIPSSKHCCSHYTSTLKDGLPQGSILLSLLLTLYLNTQEGSTTGFHPPTIAAHIVPRHSRRIYPRIPSSYHCCSHYTSTLKKGLPQDSILQTLLLTLYLNTQGGSTPGFHPLTIAAHIIPRHSRRIYPRIPSSYHCCSHYTSTLKKGLPQDSILQPLLLTLYLNTKGGSTPGFHPLIIAAHIIPQHSRRVYPRIPSSKHCCSHYTSTLKEGLPQDSILLPLLLII